MSNDILMVANPQTYNEREAAFPTQWFSTNDFLRNEELVQQHTTTLWQSFHTRGKYARIARLAQWFAVAINHGSTHISSALIIEVGEKWLIEYVMTNPDAQSKGAGSAVLNRIMTEAKQRGIKWVILNCDPEKDNGKLPTFYGKFGFTKTAE